jgi:uncharacterized glyoxalase superfamily protein PhnB
VLHRTAGLRIGDAIIMCQDQIRGEPVAIKPSSAYVYVKDVDAVYRAASANGACTNHCASACKPRYGVCMAPAVLLRCR